MVPGAPVVEVAAHTTVHPVALTAVQLLNAKAVAAVSPHACTNLQTELHYGK